MGTHPIFESDFDCLTERMGIFQRFLDWLRALFWKEEMELTLVGLQYSGKTTFVNVLASGNYSEDLIPTVGFNMRKVQKGIPVLVLGNKNDLPNALDHDGMRDRLNLESIHDRDVACYSISCKNKTNIDVVLQWLQQRAKKN